MRRASRAGAHGGPVSSWCSFGLASGLDRSPRGSELEAEIPSDVLLEVVRNAVFNSTDDLLARLDRHWRVWAEGSALPIKSKFVAPLSQLVEQAIGVDLGHALLYGLGLASSVMGWAPGQPVVSRIPAGPGFDTAKVAAFVAYVSAAEADLSASLAAETGPWAFLPFEQAPVLRSGDGGLLVLDDDYLLDRVTKGLYWAVHDFERDRGDKYRRAWSIGFSQLVERAVLEQLQVLKSPVPVIGSGAQKTFFSEDEIRAAFIPGGKRGEGRKHCDAAIWTPTCWVAIEIVNRSLTVATRHLGSMESFRDDTQKMVLEKLEQLDATAADLIDNHSRLSGLPASKQIEIQPVLIQGGRFPVHPATIAYLDQQMKQADLLQRARVRPLAIIHTDEIEMLEAAAERGEPVEDILARWQHSTRRAMPLKNLLLAESGQVPVEHHRPARISAARLKEILDQLPGGAVQPSPRPSPPT